MTEEELREQPTDEPPSARPGASTRTVIVLVVVALFAGVLTAKYLDRSQDGGAVTSQAGPSVTSVRNDAVADYEAAVATGRPIYVLFHSLS